MSELLPLVLSVGFVAGVIGNIVASIIWALPPFVALRRKLIAHHVQALAQAARHHQEVLDQAAGHHDAAQALAEKHHQESLDRADTHAAATRAHITATAGAAKSTTRKGI